jgi:hypothetical protein
MIILFEKYKNKLEINDYVICVVNDIEYIGVARRFYLPGQEDYIQIKLEFDGDDDYYNFISNYNENGMHIPENGKNYYLLWLDVINILFYSPNKKDVDAYLQANKFNL